jgi:hypothetical protein
MVRLKIMAHETPLRSLIEELNAQFAQALSDYPEVLPEVDAAIIQLMIIADHAETNGAAASESIQAATHV